MEENVDWRPWQIADLADSSFIVYYSWPWSVCVGQPRISNASSTTRGEEVLLSTREASVGITLLVNCHKHIASVETVKCQINRIVGTDCL